MNLSLEEIAAKFNGSIEGEAGLKVNQLSKIETAQLGSLSFLSHKKYASYLYTTKASAVLIKKEFFFRVKGSNCINSSRGSLPRFYRFTNGGSQVTTKNLQRN